MANKIKLGRGTKERIETIKETLDNYEIVYSMDTKELGVKNPDGIITYFGVVTELEWSNILNKPTFATVATSGAYADLTGKPDLDLKLDKNFSALPTQANPLLTDVLVLNRGTTVQKITLGNLLSQVDNEIFEVVSVLPTTGVANKIYLVPSSEPQTQNELDEFIWVDNAWEKIGSVSVDLSNYFNKTEINSMLDDKVDKVTDKGLSTNDFTNNDKNKLDGIEVGAEVNPYSKTQLDNMFDDRVDKNANITGATKTKITYDSKGLVTAGANLVEADIPALSTSKITQTASARFVTDTEKTTWNNKVDKVTGMGLSTNDYTTTEKNKLAGIASGAEVNVQSDWDATSGDALILNKPIIPTNVSQLNNDNGYITGYTETDPIFTSWNKSTGISITKSQVSDLISATQSLSGLMSATDKTRLDVLHSLLEEDTENNVVDSINEVLAIFNNYPEGADLVTALAGKVDKASGKGLSTNDYTDAEKDKLSGIQAGAQVNPSASAIKTQYESNTNTNAFTDAEKTKLTGIQEGAQVNTVTSVASKTGAVVLNQDDIGDGATYKQVSQAEKNTWNDKQNKLVAGDNITIDENTNVISAEVDPNAMSYFNYAGSVYGDRYSLLSNAWEHSLTVDPSEISKNSLSSSPSGTAQYPNGEIEGVIIPDSVTSIGELAFSDWSSNNQPLVIPNSVTSIGTTAFRRWNSNNQPLVIPNSVTSIGSGTFSFWTSNNHPLVIPDSVTSIGGSAFDDWTSNNQQLVIPDSVTSIGTTAFRRWNSNNQPLVIPDSVTSIGSGAFWGWTSNNHPLVIPNSVTEIGFGAFHNWSEVPYVEMKGTTPPSLVQSDAFGNQNNAPIYVPDESVDDYKTATNWVDLASRIFPISDKDNTYTKGEIDLMIGDIESALDAILGV